MLIDGKRISRLITIDSSPQAGWNHLMIHEVIMVHDEMELVKRGDPLGGFFWERRMLPVTCLGARDKGEVEITCKFMHSSAMESGPHFREWRWQVAHLFLDQGTEKNVRAAPILQGAGVSVREANRRLEAEEVTFEAAAVRELNFYQKLWGTSATNIYFQRLAALHR